MSRIQVFDPPMCCSTGVCGPSVNQDLVRFAADLDWLKRQGVAVERFNLAQQPSAFTSSRAVNAALGKEGVKCLPIVISDTGIISSGKYPSREDMAKGAGIENGIGLFTDSIRELVALGASVASNCEPCFRYHFAEARRLGVSKEDMQAAIEMAQAVKDRAAGVVTALADKYMGGQARPAQAEPCCGGSETASGGSCCG